jgi:hypothetical protein
MSATFSLICARSGQYLKELLDPVREVKFKLHPNGV